MWLQDVRDTLPPSAQLHGIDVDARFFPDIVSENIILSMASVTDMPSHWTNHFGLVNQRFLVASLKRQEWTRAIAEIHRVLRPGGWVQLIEPEEYEGGGEATKELQAIMASLFAVRGLVRPRESTSCIPTWLTEHGFVNLRVDRKKSMIGRRGGTDGLNWQKDAASAARGMWPLMECLRDSGLFDCGEKSRFFDIVKDAETEWDSGEPTHKVCVSIIGQKSPTGS